MFLYQYENVCWLVQVVYWIVFVHTRDSASFLCTADITNTDDYCKYE